MSLTFIDTNKISHINLPGSGEFAEILNKQLCGAENVVGSLRWLNPGEKFEVRSDKNTHHLVYLMQGEATITLDSKDYNVRKGSGVYVGPSETVAIKQIGAAPLKLFHLVVPHLQS
jgi:mannose-6-phosphate isomerase-like protein (cupin superfamily)